MQAHTHARAHPHLHTHTHTHTHIHKRTHERARASVITHKSNKYTPNDHWSHVLTKQVPNLQLLTTLLIKSHTRTHTHSLSLFPYVYVYVYTHIYLPNMQLLTSKLLSTYKLMIRVRYWQNNYRAYKYWLLKFSYWNCCCLRTEEFLCKAWSRAVKVNIFKTISLWYDYSISLWYDYCMTIMRVLDWQPQTTRVLTNTASELQLFPDWRRLMQTL